MRIKTRTLFIGKGLTRAEALQKAKKMAKADFRGFTYDSKTGYVTLT